ncbi:MAG TPA: hypothetical protein VIP46_18210 [Pyrinomonadaceae bacterium]
MTKKQLPVIPASPLPPLYAAWVDELLAGGHVPHESDATCDDCAMCAGEGREPQGGGTFFNPQTKCCAYVPELPNYLVGRALEDADSAPAGAGRETVGARLRAGVGVTPLGLGQPPLFAVLYGRSPATLFGQSRALRCPHYLADGGGRCGVWEHRPSVCATWHCKYVRGATGQNFWQALHRLLSEVERDLARWCVYELDPGGAALRLLFPARDEGGKGAVDPHALDGAPDPERQSAIWGDWAGREADYYRACARLVESLTWAGVLARCGPSVRIHARLASAAYRQLMSAELPAALRVGPFHSVRLDADAQIVTSYNVYDPIALSAPLVGVLHYFDGRPTERGRADIAAERGITIDEALVRKLVDFKVLVPCERPAGES